MFLALGPVIPQLLLSRPFGWSSDRHHSRVTDQKLNYLVGYNDPTFRFIKGDLFQDRLLSKTVLKMFPLIKSIVTFSDSVVFNKRPFPYNIKLRNIFLFIPHLIYMWYLKYPG